MWGIVSPGQVGTGAKRKGNDMRRLMVLGLLAAGLPLGSSVLAEEKFSATHKGKVPFIVGYEKGRMEATFSGRPMMLFFTATW